MPDALATLRGQRPPDCRHTAPPRRGLTHAVEEPASEVPPNTTLHAHAPFPRPVVILIRPADALPQYFTRQCIYLDSSYPSRQARVHRQLPAAKSRRRGSLPHIIRDGVYRPAHVPDRAWPACQKKLRRRLGDSRCSRRRFAGRVNPRMVQTLRWRVSRVEDENVVTHRSSLNFQAIRTPEI